MKFKYRGVTKTREIVNGLVEAADTHEAQLKLRSQQIRPLSLVEAKKAKGSKQIHISFLQKKPGLKELVVFTRQFSSLIDSGVPVVQCLDILFQQEANPFFKNVLGTVKADIEGGAGLADALGKYPKIFGDFFIRIVEAGEVSGTLDKAIRRVGIQLERLGRIKAKVVGALIYPVITLVVAVVVLMFLLIKVIPEISKLYGESSAKLPDITLAVLDLSNWMQNNWWIIAGVGVGAVLAAPAVYKLEGFRKVFDPFALKIPGFGQLIKKSAIARFTRTLSTLISSGVPLLNSFDICMRLINNLAIKDTIASAMASVTEGKSIAQGLSKGNLFPPMVIHMVSIGEMTGKLDDLLGKVADIYDDELDDAVSTVTGLIQPMLIVGVGAIIAFLLLAMYLPIFQLAEKVTGGA